MIDVLLSGFADEATPDKTIDSQFATMAALGLEFLSIRFVNIGDGVQNVLALSDSGFELIRQRLLDYGIKISSIGSPVGKVKIADVDDGTTNRYVPFNEYLKSDVRSAIHAAEQMETKLIRGFSFYHPRKSKNTDYLNQAVEQIGEITEMCDQHGMTFGLEVEANLIGNTGSILSDIHRQINNPALVLVFDGANLVTQGFNSLQILEQFRQMLPGLGWMHVKDYLSGDGGANSVGGYIDEETLDRFVPADRGSTGHQAIFSELLPHLPSIMDRLDQRGVPGFFVDLEPHLRGGGQFGGFSGPDGMGIALRSLCDVFRKSGVRYQLKTFDKIRT